MNKEEREVMRMALEALKEITEQYRLMLTESLDIQHKKYATESPVLKHSSEAITAIEEALAQPEPWEKFCDSNCVWTDHHPDCKLAHEPVSAQCKFESEDLWLPCSIEHHNFVQSEPEKWPQYQTRLLYTMPLQCKPLSDEEIKKINWSKPMNEYEFARAIEAAHGIKGEA